MSFHFQSEIQLAHAVTPQLEQAIGLIKTFLQRQHKSNLMFASVSLDSPSVCSMSILDLVIVLDLLNQVCPFSSLA